MADSQLRRDCEVAAPIVDETPPAGPDASKAERRDRQRRGDLMIELTPEQSQTLRAAVLILQEKTRAGEKGPRVNTVELSGKTGRVGQVVGLICSNLAKKGLLERTSRGFYKLTPAGLSQLQRELANGVAAAAVHPKVAAVNLLDAEIAADQTFDRMRR